MTEPFAHCRPHARNTLERGHTRVSTKRRPQAVFRDCGRTEFTVLQGVVEGRPTACVTCPECASGLQQGLRHDWLVEHSRCVKR